MCNLYSMTRARDAIRLLFRVDRDHTGNQPPLPAIFPDQLAPVVRRDREGARVMQPMRWGFPPPPNAGGRPVTKRPQHGQPLLARLAAAGVPLPGAGDIVLRV